MTDCCKCPVSGAFPPIWVGRRNIVCGYGSRVSDVMFIGEAPGIDEDIEGVPFVGRAGEIFDRLLDSIGLDREMVYVTNVLKCRPTTFQGANRAPTCYEIRTCLPYLLKEIKEVQPRVICPMGRISLSCFLSDKRIYEVHGKPHNYGDKILIPLYHPSYAIINPDMLETMKRDISVVKKGMERS